MKALFKKCIVAILTLESKAVLAKYKPQIIAVTGNIGKTSTKDAIGSVLSVHKHVRKSDKSYNSEFGVTLTILGAESGWSSPTAWLAIIVKSLWQIIVKVDYPEILVLEVGADGPGDIQHISKWLKPDITVITQFQKVPVHVEFFKDRSALIREKGYLVESTKKDGLIVFTSDDHDSHELAKLSHVKKVSFGFENWADIQAESLDTLYEVVGDIENPVGLSARITLGDVSIPMRIMGVLGGGHIYSALPALYIGTLFGVNLHEGVQAIEMYPKPKGRMRLLRGVKKTTIIDDTYNASPKAVEHALKTLAGLHTNGKKIAVLGDMLELGKESASEHFRIGEIAAESAHVLVTIGIRSREIAEGALSKGMLDSQIFQYESSREAGIFVETILEKEDIVLVKGSQSVRAERVVEEILAEADRVEELLVRQEKEWKAR
jgi:UDP-N-acetylmuramoyl-tripeptide--D-alanyl-D-alanine ligase